MNRPNDKYCSQEQPPVCLHILGQDLVNALFVEAVEWRQYALELEKHRTIVRPPQEIPANIRDFIKKHREIIDKYRQEDVAAHEEFMAVAKELNETDDSEKIGELSRKLGELARRNEKQYTMHREHLQKLADEVGVRISF